MPQTHYTTMEDHNVSDDGNTWSWRRWEKPFCIVVIGTVFLLGMMSELSVRKATLTGRVRSPKMKMKVGTEIEIGQPRLTESFAHGLGFFSQHTQEIYVSSQDKRVEMGVKCAEADYRMISCGCEYADRFIVEGTRIDGNTCTCRWRTMDEVSDGHVNFSAHSSCVYSGE